MKDLTPALDDLKKAAQAVAPPTPPLPEVEIVVPREFLDELKAGTIPLRDTDPYDIDEKDAEYVLNTGDFWRKECLSAKVDEYIPLGYFDAAGRSAYQPHCQHHYAGRQTGPC